MHFVDSAWLEHGPFAFWLAGAVRPKIFVELGTHNGFSYLAFCQAARRLGQPVACYAVDTWIGDEHAGFYGEEVYTRLTALNEEHYAAFSRLLRCRFDEALPHFADGTVDILHIDGRHTYEDAREDFENWRPKLSASGVVLFHDTNVRERDFGVWRLWAELRRHHPTFEFLHGHGLGVLAFGPEVPAGLRPLLEADPDQANKIRTAYARLGYAVSRQYLLQRARRSLGEAAAEQDRLRAEQQATVQAAAAEQDRLQAEQQATVQAAAAEQDRLQAERDRHEQAARHADVALVQTRSRIEALDQANADLRALLNERQRTLHALHDTLNEQARTVAGLQAALAVQGRVGEAAQARLSQIEQSTFWRATDPLRRTLDRLPRPLGLAIRRGVKAVWWAVTPHRMPARIALLRARRQWD